jgi:hypothetical protein
VSRTITTVCLVAALALAAAGCTSTDEATPPPSPSPTSASPSATLSPRQSAEAQAMDAYNKLWQATAQAGTVPDPDAPALREYATGDALALIVGVMVSYREKGVVTRGVPVTNPRVTSVDPADAPTQVNLLDCGDSTDWAEYDKASGKMIEGSRGGHRRITAEVRWVDGRWKVASYDIGDLGSC